MREMKDSGIEWVGETPKKWEIIKNKYLITMLYSGGTPSATNEKFYCQENGTPFVSISDMSNCSYVTTTKKHITELGIQDKKLQIMPKGTILYSIYATVGAISELRIEAAISQAILAIKVNSKILKSFYKYNLEAMRDYIFSNASGNTQFNLNAEKVRNFYFVHPPLSEQQKISTYLDTKCTKIDSIIEKQEKVIEKLKAYKLSVITEAVTKGLNSDVKMKDSGVEFLGEVPENWEVIKFGRCITIKSNLVPPENYYDYPQIAPDSIEKNSARLLYYKTVRESGVISWNHLFYKGQIIYSKIRPLLNKVIIAPFDGLCSADMYPIETENNSKFIVYVILSDYFSAQVGLFTENRVKMPKINQNELSGIIVAMPELEEQQQIAAYLDKKCSAIDSAIEKKQAIIEKLKEYKKSLIYEVVTGKKEV